MRRVKVTRVESELGYGFAFDSSGTVHFRKDHYVSVIQDENGNVQFGNITSGVDPKVGDELMVEDTIQNTGGSYPSATVWVYWRDYEGATRTSTNGQPKPVRVANSRRTNGTLHSLSQLGTALGAPRHVRVGTRAAKRPARAHVVPTSSQEGTLAISTPDTRRFITLFHGKVAEFFPERAYGFINQKGRGKVHFRRSSYAHMRPDTQNPGQVRFFHGELAREPQEGDEVAFELTKIQSGLYPTAAFWTYKTVYEHAMTEAQTLVSPSSVTTHAPSPDSLQPSSTSGVVQPQAQRYRVHEIRTTTIASGVTLDQLKSQFPNGVLHNQQLTPDLGTQYVFEVEKGDTWQEVPDPRNPASSKS